MSDWQLVIITVVVPVLITAGLPFMSEKLKAKREERSAKHEERVSDAEIGARLRDELWQRNTDLTERVTTLESENDSLRSQLGVMEVRVMRLEDALRRHGHANEIELTRQRRMSDAG